MKRTGNSKIAVVGWGRGMGHKGHMYLADAVITQAINMKADPYFFVSKTVGKDDPIFPEEKVRIYQKVFPQYATIFEPQGNLNQALQDLAGMGYQGVVVVVGADQKQAFQYLEKPNKEGVPVFQSMGLKKLKVISRQETNSKFAGEEGPRATPMREVLLDPNASEEDKFKVWRRDMPEQLSDRDVLEIMNKAESRLVHSHSPRQDKVKSMSQKAAKLKEAILSFKVKKPEQQTSEKESEPLGYKHLFKQPDEEVKPTEKHYHGWQEYEKEQNPDEVEEARIIMPGSKVNVFFHPSKGGAAVQVAKAVPMELAQRVIASYVARNSREGYRPVSDKEFEMRPIDANQYTNTSQPTLKEFAPDEGGGSRKFIPWNEFVDQLKQILHKDFDCKESINMDVIKAKFVPYDPMEYGPTQIYSYFERRAGRKGANSVRGQIQVGKFMKGQSGLMTSYQLLKGTEFERYFDLTFDNLYKIANIIKGNTQGKLETTQEVEEAGVTRRGILKGIGAAGLAGSAGKASAIAGAFPSPSTRQKWANDAAASNRAEAARQAELQRQARAAQAAKLAQNTQDVERLNKVNYHGKDAPKPSNAEWDGDSDFLYLDGTQYAKASRMPISGDVPSDLTLVATKEGRQVYIWTRRSLKGVQGHYFYPAEKPNTINEFAPDDSDDGENKVWGIYHPLHKKFMAQKGQRTSFDTQDEAEAWLKSSGRGKQGFITIPMDLDEGLTKLPSGDYQNSHTGVRTSKPPAKKKRGQKTGAEWDAIEKAKKEQGNQLDEFAPSGDDGNDGFNEETLKMLAAQWYNGNEDPRVERTLMAAGWEIGQDEGYDDEPGVFVVQSGDTNGDSYLSWSAHELRQHMNEDYLDE